MVRVKQSVGPFVLEDSGGGSYRWVNRQDVGGGDFVYTLDVFKEGGDWTLIAGLHGEGFGRHQPEQVQQVEQYGAPRGYAKSFKHAKDMAYAFMKRFSGSPGYNGLLNLAGEARWVHRDHGPYYD